MSHNPYLLSDFFVLDSALSTLWASPHTDPTTLWDGDYYYHPHSTNEETEAWNGQVFSPDDPNGKWQSQDLAWAVWLQRPCSYPLVLTCIKPSGKSCWRQDKVSVPLHRTPSSLAPYMSDLSVPKSILLRPYAMAIYVFRSQSLPFFWVSSLVQLVLSNSSVPSPTNYFYSGLALLLCLSFLSFPSLHV